MTLERGQQPHLVVWVCFFVKVVNRLGWRGRGFGSPHWDKVWQMGGWKLGSLAAAAAAGCGILWVEGQTQTHWWNICPVKTSTIILFLHVCSVVFFPSLPCTVPFFFHSITWQFWKQTNKRKKTNSFAYLDPQSTSVTIISVNQCLCSRHQTAKTSVISSHCCQTDPSVH